MPLPLPFSVKNVASTMKGRARLMIVSSPKCWAKLLRCSTFSGPQTLEVGDTRCVSQDPKHSSKFYAVELHASRFLRFQHCKSITQIFKLNVQVLNQVWTRMNNLCCSGLTLCSQQQVFGCNSVNVLSKF